MERFIDKLKKQSLVEEIDTQDIKKEKAKLKAENPCIVCCVTMGKEPHAGHLFLLTIAEQIQRSMDSKIPLVLINNNTGPRAAGAVVEVSNHFGVSLEEAADLMNNKCLDITTVVSAYRGRKDSSPELEEATQLLSSGRFDIFAAITTETEALMNFAGFNIQIVSEASLQQLAVSSTKELSPAWTDTGFTPFIDNRRLVILQKAGGLTATGNMVTTLRALSDGMNADLMLIIDSMPDAADAAFVFSETSPLGICSQIPGSGIMFGGEMASGTKGESWTIREVSEKFYKQNPNGNLRQATLFLTLTRPLCVLTGSPDLAYDFRDNQAMIDLIIKCSDEATKFVLNTQSMIESLELKIGEVSSASSKPAKKLLEYLNQRAQALFDCNQDNIIATTKKVDPVTSPELIGVFSKELGYPQDGSNPYITKKRVLGIRKNYFFAQLTGLIRTIQDIESITVEDFLTISQMLQFCIERTGL